MWASQVALVVKNPPAHAGDLRDVSLIPGSGRSPGGRHGNPLQYSCLENPMDRGDWQTTVHRVAKSQTRLNDLTRMHTIPHSRSKNWIVPFWRNRRKKCHFLPILFFFLILCPLRRAYTTQEITKACVRKEREKAMATHSSTLAWKILWMEEPGRLQSMGLQRVGHDRVTSLLLVTFMHWRRKWQPTPVFLPGESQGRGSLMGCCLWGRTESDTTETT